MRLLDHGFAVITSDTRAIVDEESASKTMSTMVVRKLFLEDITWQWPCPHLLSLSCKCVAWQIYVQRFTFGFIVSLKIGMNQPIITKLNGKREKQQQSIKSEKVTEDNANIKMDSGFLSGANLSCDMLSKENIEYDVKNKDLNFKELMETPTIVVDSGLDICESGCLSELDVDQKDTCKSYSKTELNWQFYFQQNEDGDTQLHLAILHGYIQVSKRLIDICPDSKLLDIRNDDGQSALHLAVITNQCEIVKYLMMANANAEVLDCNGNTAVHLACYGGKLDCLRILASYVLLPKIFDTINYDGLACIHIATIANHPNLLRFIVNSSKNVNITDYKSGYTALHFAVALNRANLIECLLDKVDPNIESYAGKLAFEIEGDYDEDEEDNEISDDLVKSMNVLQLPNNSSIKC